MAYIWAKTGTPLAFTPKYSGFERHLGNPVLVVINGLLGRGIWGGYVSIYLALVGVFAVAASGYLLWEHRPAESVFLFITVLIPLGTQLRSITRYVVGTLLIFYAITDLVDRYESGKWVLLGAFAMANAALLILWFNRSRFLM